MKAYKVCLGLVSGLAVAFAVVILLIPADAFQMVLNLRSGRQADPGKCLVVLPTLYDSRLPAEQA